MNATNSSNLVMYVVAKEKYLASLLRDGKITQSDFEKMSQFLYDRFHIAEIPTDRIQQIRTNISLATPGAVPILETTPAEMAAHNIELAESIAEPSSLISLTESARALSEESPGHVIQSWMRDRSTLEFMALWEAENNADFNRLGYESLMEQQSGSFTMTPKQWIDQTGAMGLVSKQGRNGGTYAHPMIACEFMLWLSPAYKLTFLEMRSGC